MFKLNLIINAGKNLQIIIILFSIKLITVYHRFFLFQIKSTLEIYSIWSNYYSIQSSMNLKKKGKNLGSIDHQEYWKIKFFILPFKFNLIINAGKNLQIILFSIKPITVYHRFFLFQIKSTRDLLDLIKLLFDSIVDEFKKKKKPWIDRSSRILKNKIFYITVQIKFNHNRRKKRKKFHQCIEKKKLNCP